MSASSTSCDACSNRSFTLARKLSMGFVSGSVGGLRRTVSCVLIVLKRQYSRLISFSTSNLCDISLQLFLNITWYALPLLCRPLRLLTVSVGRLPMSRQGWRRRIYTIVCLSVAYPYAATVQSCRILICNDLQSRLPYIFVHFICSLWVLLSALLYFVSSVIHFIVSPLIGFGRSSRRGTI
jgi:hypothetical protein